MASDEARPFGKAYLAEAANGKMDMEIMNPKISLTRLSFHPLTRHSLTTHTTTIEPRDHR